MQIEKLHRALNTLTKEERELMEAIFYKEESLRSIGKKRKSKLSNNRKKEGQNFRKTEKDFRR